MFLPSGPKVLDNSYLLVIFLLPIINFDPHRSATDPTTGDGKGEFHFWDKGFVWFQLTINNEFNFSAEWS